MAITREKLETMKLRAEEVTFLTAIKEALTEAMREDESVFIIGEDVGVYGGAFKVTEGLINEFAAKRVVDVPIAESGFIGAAIGASLMGLKPVVEVQYADFISCGWDQIVNVAAKLHYRTGDSVPLVIRGPSGAGLRAGPFHSQSPELWFAHCPGLKVVVPATPTDAKGLLKAAIYDPNPVIFFEHKYLYRRIKERLPVESYVTPIGKARVDREGNDLAVITYGAMLYKAREAAAILEKEGVSTEIIDLRTIYPLDRQAIINTVKKTSKVMVLVEDTLSYGVSAEIAATIAEQAFEYLDAPVVRIAPPDTPIPFSPPLEDAFLPQTESIIAKAKELLSY